MNDVDPFMTQTPEVLIKNNVKDDFDLAFGFTSKVKADNINFYYVYTNQNS